MTNNSKYEKLFLKRGYLIEKVENGYDRGIETLYDGNTGVAK